MGKTQVVMIIVVVTSIVTAMVPTIGAAQTGPGYDIETSRMIPIRDGVQLEAWIFKPSNLKTKAPAVLELTQYDIDGARRSEFSDFVRRGYVFVQVYVRGRGRSGGDKTDNLGLQVGRMTPE